MDKNDERVKDFIKVCLSILLGVMAGGIITNAFLPGLWWILGATIGGLLAAISYRPSVVWKTLRPVGSYLADVRWKDTILGIGAAIIVVVIVLIGIVATMGFVHLGLFICQHNDLTYKVEGKTTPILNAYDSSNFFNAAFILLIFFVFAGIICTAIGDIIEIRRRGKKGDSFEREDFILSLMRKVGISYYITGFVLLGLFNPWTAEAVWYHIAPFCLSGVMLLTVAAFLSAVVVALWLVMKILDAIWWLCCLIFNDNRLYCFVCAFLGVACSVWFGSGIFNVLLCAVGFAWLGYTIKIIAYLITRPAKTDEPKAKVEETKPAEEKPAEEKPQQEQAEIEPQK